MLHHRLNVRLLFGEQRNLAVPLQHLHLGTSPPQRVTSPILTAHLQTVFQIVEIHHPKIWEQLQKKNIRSLLPSQQQSTDCFPAKNTNTSVRSPSHREQSEIPKKKIKSNISNSDNSSITNKNKQYIYFLTDYDYEIHFFFVIRLCRLFLDTKKIFCDHRTLFTFSKFFSCFFLLFFGLILTENMIFMKKILTPPRKVILEP